MNLWATFGPHCINYSSKMFREFNSEGLLFTCHSQKNVSTNVVNYYSTNNIHNFSLKYRNDEIIWNGDIMTISCLQNFSGFNYDQRNQYAKRPKPFTPVAFKRNIKLQYQEHISFELTQNITFPFHYLKWNYHSSVKSIE